MKKRQLISDNPELLKEWDYEKNIGANPNLITAGNARTKIWWKCERNHSWKCSASNRKYGTGCPYCKGKRPIIGETDLESQAPELMKLWDWEQELSPQSVSCSSEKKAFWICEKGHRWEAAVKDVVRGSRCPVCAGRSILKGFNDLATVLPELAKEWDFQKNEGLMPDQIAPAARRKVWWRCKEGHSWEAAVYHRNRGTGCPYCSGNLPIPNETDLTTLYPELIYEWNTEKNLHSPEKYTASSPRIVWWRCSKGHEWKASIYSRTKANSRCPYCIGKKALPGENDLLTIYPYLADEWDFEKNIGLDPSTLRPSSGKKVWWHCKNGHQWRTSVQTRSNGRGCPYCYGKIPIYSRLI